MSMTTISLVATAWIDDRRISLPTHWQNDVICARALQENLLAFRVTEIDNEGVVSIESFDEERGMVSMNWSDDRT